MSHFISKNMEILNHKIDRMVPMPESPFAFRDDESFRKRIKESKGFCLSHFGDLCTGADRRLSGPELDEFYSMLLPLMERNLDRLQEDVNWLIEKFDYRNKDADWKDSKDAVQRGMQKLKGGYPADPPLKMKK